MSRSTILYSPLAAWASIVGAGIFALAKYDATPGPAPTPDVHLPVPHLAAAVSDKMTLVMFVHPGCPCSAASLEELSALMARCGSRLHASVLIFRPSREPDKWNDAPMWRKASEIPGVVVRADADAVLARKCGAQTSGQVFLYDRSGGLLFQGGITGARGHVGDNEGLDAVTDIIFEQAASKALAPRLAAVSLPAVSLSNPSNPSNARPAQAPVFGCAIYSND